MTIDPQLQLQMLAAALLAGLLLGVLYDLLAALRIFAGAYVPPPYMQPYYQRPLPLVGAPGGVGRKKPVRRLWQWIVVATGDLIYCLAVAAAVALILYRYNRGVFRVAVPLLLFFALFLWRATASRLSAAITDGLAFGLFVTARYLWALCCLPFRLLWQGLDRFLYRPCAARYRKRRLLKKERISALLCRRQLMAAAGGFGAWQRAENDNDRKKKGREKRNVKKKG